MKSILLIFVMLMTGCSQIDTSSLHDERMTTGCAVVMGEYSGYFVKGGASACKLVCSENLPSGFAYEYNSGGCTVSIKN